MTAGSLEVVNSYIQRVWCLDIYRTILLSLQCGIPTSIPTTFTSDGSLLCFKAKYLERLCFGKPFLMLARCSPTLICRSLLVLPTYCLPQLDWSKYTVNVLNSTWYNIFNLIWFSHYRRWKSCSPKRIRTHKFSKKVGLIGGSTTFGAIRGLDPGAFLKLTFGCFGKNCTQHLIVL